ncbi:RNA ligase [Lysinibacillus sp. NPDC086135]|uniref:RNA ligase n=1 Tax=Lysinibacillus sp. NPDC086135 TaxID=3364130 RepID=UPI0037F30A21
MDYSWNPVYNLVIEIKKEYKKLYTDGSLHFEKWLDKLNNEKFNEVFECLQVNQHKEFLLIRYGLQEMQKGMWEDSDSIYRECRSVVIDLLNEELVLTPFRKFFNLDEVEENKLELVKMKFNNAKVVEASNKLDGSMQNARWYRDEVFMTGSMSLSKEDSWRLNEGYSMLNQNYVQMLKDYDEYTFIFEYISLKDAHVVLYDKKDEGLHLIGMRNTFTGEQVNYNELIEIANTYRVTVVEMENKSLEQLLDEMKSVSSHEKEGWVLNLDGHLIKLKCDDYVSIHRLLDKVSSVNVIIENIAENRFDDLIAKIPDKYKERVHNIANLIFEYINTNTGLINEYYEKAPKCNRKEYMIWVTQSVPKEIQVYLRNKYLGIEYHLLKKGNNGYKRMSELGFDDKYSVLFASVGGSNNE